MNIYSVARNQFNASAIAILTILSLLLSALPAAFFVAEAATAIVTPEEFVTVDGTYKGVSVGFRTAGFGTVTDVSVTIERSDGSTITKTANQGVLDIINLDTPGGDQLTAPFVIQEGTFTEASDTLYWDPAPATWSVTTRPVKAIISVTDESGTVVAENLLFNEGSPSWPTYQSLIPVIKTTEKIIIRGNTSAGENLSGWLFNRDQATKSPFEFNTDQAVVGEGSLYVLPIGANASDKFIGELFLSQTVGTIETISYDYRLGDSVPASEANEFYANVYMNFDTSGNFGHCVYSIVPTNGSAGWHTMTFNPELDYPVRQRSSSPSPCPSSPADMGPNAVLRMFALNVGDTTGGDLGVNGYFDNVIVDTVTKKTIYDFEPDTKKPIVAIVSPDNESIVGVSFPVFGTASDAETEIDKVLYTVTSIDMLGGDFMANVTSGTANGAEDWTFSVTNLLQGFYRLKVQAFDLAGNWRFDYHDVEVDTTKPSVVITSPLNGAVLDNTSFTVTGTAADAKTGIKEVKYTVTNITGIGGTYVDLIASSTAIGKENWSFEVPALANGFYRLKVQAFDEVGNWRYEYHDVQIKGNRPFISVVNPPNGYIAYEDFEITVSATDNSGLGQVVINLKDEDGNNLAPCLNELAGGVKEYTTSCVVDVDELGPGIYGFKANVRDLQGNISNTVSQTFEIRELPEASLVITSPGIDAVVTDSGLFTAEFTDDDLIVDTFQWAIRAGTCERGQGTVAGNVDGFDDSYTFVGTTFTALFDATELEDGEYCFVVNPREQSDEADLRATRTFTKETPLLTCEIKSDTGTVIIENNSYAVETYKHRNWTALIPGAQWIWETFYIEDPTVNTTRTFTETFNVSGIDSAVIDIAADNGYQLFVNNQLVVDRRDIENNFQAHTQNDYDIKDFLVEGPNTFSIEVTNKGVNNSTKLQNPAGVLYKLTINAETACEITTKPITTTEPDNDSDNPGDDEGTDNGDEESPVDVCPDIEGVQETIPSGYEKVGESQNCTLIPVIENPEDEDEGENNRSGGNSTGTLIPSLAQADFQPLVLGAATSQCGMLLTGYMRMGQANDPMQVMWLQLFLISQGFNLQITKEFDAATDAAVRAFQEKYRADILDPWITAGILQVSNPTGWVYQLTRYKINNMICPGSEPMPNLI